MNAEELSLIGPVVDLASVDAIHRKRLLAFVNHFLIHTAKFLNNFARSCDSKLLQVQLKMQKLEASIILLESKLSSIPGLDTPISNTVNNAEVPKPENAPIKESVSSTDTDIPGGADETISHEEESSQQSLDSALQKYVKMLQVRVPLPAVKLKMQQDGISIEQQNLVLS